MNTRTTRTAVAVATGIALLVPAGVVAASASEGHSAAANHQGQWNLFHGWHDDTSDGKVPAATRAPKVSVSDTSVTISWDAPRRDGGSAVESYVILREVRTDAGVTRTTLSSNDNLLVESLNQLPGGRIHYAVSAINATGAGDFSDWSETIVVVQPPTAPVAVTGAVSGGQVVAQWKAPRTNGGAKLSGYVVRVVPVRTSSISHSALVRKANTNAFWKVGRSSATQPSARTVNTTRSVLGKAKKGYTYVIAVEAKNSQGKVSHRSVPTFITVK